MMKKRIFGLIMMVAPMAMLLYAGYQHEGLLGVLVAWFAGLAFVASITLGVVLVTGNKVPEPEK